jgi:hypothetical protein
MRHANLALRFALELSALGALAYWGFTRDAAWPVRLLLGTGAPLAAALLWGTFVAPKARQRLPDPWRLLPEASVFLSAAAALVAAGRPGLALALILAAAANVALLFAWRQRSH